MSLNGVDSSGGALVCTSTDGYAVSNPQVNEVIVFNDDFTNGNVNGWTTDNGAISTFNADNVVIDRNGNSWNEFFYIDIPDLIVGTTATIDIKFDVLSGASGSVLVDDLNHYAIDNESSGIYSASFKVNNSTTRIIINPSGDVNTQLKIYYIVLTSGILSFNGINNAIGKFEFANISESTDPDLLVTNEKIKDGDKLIIVKDDDSINKTTAAGVIDVPYTNGDFTTGKIGTFAAGSGIAEIDTNRLKITATALYPFVRINMADFPKNEEYDLTIIGCTAGNPRVDIDINGNDGLGNANPALTGTYRFTTGSMSTAFQLFDLNGNTGSIFYVDKILFKRISTGEYLTLHEYKMDTSSITSGEVPSRVFRVDERVLFNDAEASVVSDNYSYIYGNVALENDPLGDGSCIAYYKLDDNLVDEIGNNDGSVTGTISYSDSPWNRALTVNTTRLNGARLYKLDTSKPFSISAMVKGTDVFILNGIFNVAYPSIKIEKNNILMCRYNNIDTGAGDAAINLKYDESWLKSDEYSNIIAVVNYPDVRVYTEGNIIAIGKMNFNVGPSNYPVSLAYTGRDLPHNASYDIVRFFNKALTDAEVQKIYTIDRLTCDKSFSNIGITPSAEARTKVQMSATGNKMTQLDFDIMKEP